jgi:hypothetical protein
MSNITDRPPQRGALLPTPAEFALACKSLQQRAENLRSCFQTKDPIADLLPEIEELALRARRLCEFAKLKATEERGAA